MLSWEGFLVDVREGGCGVIVGHGVGYWPAWTAAVVVGLCCRVDEEVSLQPCRAGSVYSTGHDRVELADSMTWPPAAKAGTTPGHGALGGRSQRNSWP
jgi:hypothetical protein